MEYIMANKLKAIISEMGKAATALNVIVDAAIKSSLATDTQIQEAAVACIKHFDMYKDAMPMDRLVKGVAPAHRQPLIFWVKSNSPIHWLADKSVAVTKEGEKGYVPVDVQKAEKVAYHATPEAMARNNKTIEPLTVQTLVGKIGHLRTLLKKATAADTKTGFDDSYGTAKDAAALIDKLEATVEPFKTKAEKAHKAWLRAQKAQREPVAEMTGTNG